MLTHFTPPFLNEICALVEHIMQTSTPILLLMADLGKLKQLIDESFDFFDTVILVSHDVDFGIFHKL